MPTLVHCEVGVRPRIRVNYFSDYYGQTNLPDTTLIVTSRGVCTIKNSKNYVIFYTVNIDVLVMGHSTSNEMMAHALRPRILFNFF